ncbi:MAG: ribonuclease D [Steroidobacteraceae bacterium]
MSALITTLPELASAAEALAGNAALGLDTEFMRERTYYAQLCLLQLAGDGLAVCIDPLALDSLAALRPLMEADTPCKILHAARQDLEVLAPAIGTVRNIFDTQVGAALIGLPAQIGYADLVQELLGIHLHKSQTRTDWSRRPLSAAQLEYAIDDVRHLLPLRERLIERLGQLGRHAWFDEEMRELGAASFAIDPQQAWRRIKSFADLDPDRQRLAQQLCAWREQRAISSNRPRGWIIPDAALRDLVFQVPRSRAALAQLRELPEGIRENSGAVLLELIDAAQVPEPPAPLPPRRRPDPEQLATVTRLAETTRRMASELSLAPELLATRRDMERLAGGERDCAMLTGWRREVIGAALLNAL